MNHLFLLCQLRGRTYLQMFFWTYFGQPKPSPSGDETLLVLRSVVQGWDVQDWDGLQHGTWVESVSAKMDAVCLSKWTLYITLYHFISLYITLYHFMPLKSFKQQLLNTLWLCQESLCFARFPWNKILPSQLTWPLSTSSARCSSHQLVLPTWSGGPSSCTNLVVTTSPRSSQAETHCRGSVRATFLPFLAYLSKTKATETVRCCRRVVGNLALCHAHHFHLPSSSSGLDECAHMPIALQLKGLQSLTIPIILFIKNWQKQFNIV